HCSRLINTPSASSFETTYFPLSILSWPRQSLCMIKRTSLNVYVAARELLTTPDRTIRGLFSYLRAFHKHEREIRLSSEPIDQKDGSLGPPSITQRVRELFVRQRQPGHRLRDLVAHVLDGLGRR